MKHFVRYFRPKIGIFNAIYRPFISTGVSLHAQQFASVHRLREFTASHYCDMAGNSSNMAAVPATIDRVTSLSPPHVMGSVIRTQKIASSTFFYCVFFLHCNVTVHYRMMPAMCNLL